MVKLCQKMVDNRLSLSDWFALFLRDKEYLEEDGEPLNRAEFLALNRWRPDKEEKEEFDRLMSQWQNILFAEIDAKMAYYSLEQQCLKTRDWLMYFSSKDHKLGLLKNYLQSHTSARLREDSLNVLLDNSWIESDHLAYLLAFELMDLGMRKDLWICHRNIMLDENYLRDQETVADILRDNDGLSEATKEKIAEVIIDKLYYGSDQNHRLYLCWHNFITFPTIEIGRRFVRRHNISCLPTEKEKKEYRSFGARLREEFILKRVIIDHVEKYNINLKEQFQNIAKELLDEGLLETASLLWGNNNRIKGDKGDHTSRSGQKMHEEWKHFTELAETELNRLIGDGSLVSGFLNKRKYCSIVSGEHRVISAKSLYELKCDYGLVRDFRQQMSDLGFFGTMISLWNKKSYDSNYLVLSQSIKTIRKSAETLGADFSHKFDEIKGYIDELDVLAKEVDNQVDGLVDCYIPNDWNNRTIRKFTIRIKLSSLKDLKL